jgi:23S rRNA pseudouridine955/2504/2580 synthase
MEDVLRLLYDNAHIWIFDKPAGIAVQGGHGVKESFDKIIEDNLYEKPYPVHRLDKETGGVLLVAKNSAAAAKFGRYFSRNKALKFYKAVVRGRFPKSMEIYEDITDSRGKPLRAHSSVFLEKHYGSFSLLKLQLHTGRMHQLRIHLQKKGYPIIGDNKYGDFTLNRRIKKELGADNLMLYAGRLVIAEERIDITAEMPDYFKVFLKNAPILKTEEQERR